MRQHLDAIAASLARLGRNELLDRLNPGTERTALASRLRAAGLAAPTRLCELFEWHDGTRVEPGVILDDVQFFPGFYFCSSGDALTNYGAFRDDPRWQEGWLPIFANGGGDFYAIDLAAVEHDDAPVVGFMLGQPDHPIEYEGLELMFATLAKSFEVGAFFVDERGYLEADDVAHGEVARIFNPRVDLWRTH